MLIRNKKGGMAIAVGLLVLATLVLVSFSLYVFIIREKTMRDPISVPPEIEGAYVAEQQIRFYLDSGGDKEKIKELFEVEKDGDYFVVNKKWINKDTGKEEEIIYKFKVSNKE